MKISTFFLFLLFSNSVWAQLGFCEGSKGDPIFHETFGSGSSSGPALPFSVTSYTFVTGDPEDGQYTISNTIGQKITTWHSRLPATGISNGRALIVNASYTSGQFYKTKITGLCQNTTYEFSAYLMNIYNRSSNACENGGIPINVRFEIWDQNESVLLKEGSTGSIHSTNSPQWKQFALTFQSEPDQGSVILKMFNNAAGGCGNDLAIDDIIFRSCGDLTEVTDQASRSNLQVCQENTPVDIKLQAASDSSVYSDQYYQWQQSKDNRTWQDIPGENRKTFHSPAVTSSTYYRVKVAEDPLNLQNNLCSSASEAFFIDVSPTPLAPESLGDVVICSNETSPGLRVRSEDNESIDWYDAPTGGKLIAEDSNPFHPGSEGTYYAQARKTGTTCAPGLRTAISYTVYQAPSVRDETLYLCSGSSVILDSGVENMNYHWSTGATSRTISVSNSGIYSVNINTPKGCSSTKTIEVKKAAVPVITKIVSEGPAVSIVLEDPTDFVFSLDGLNFQDSGHFPSLKGGVYTVHVRHFSGCAVVTKEFAHLVLPLFITPNNDGYNDHFELPGVSFFGSSEIRIFDRYGKLMAAGPGENFKWDGNAGSDPLPSQDFWYYISIEGFAPIKGHFSLLR